MGTKRFIALSREVDTSTLAAHAVVTLFPGRGISRGFYAINHTRGKFLNNVPFDRVIVAVVLIGI